MIKLMLVVGARPNFMKVAPMIRQINDGYADLFSFVLVHTGQHYDKEMSDAFFRDLSIPPPNYNLGVGSASHAIQTAKIMGRFEPVCLKESPDCIVVFGDVNSTLACALVGVKEHFRVAHVEAGLRSFDRAMPEEINRVVTDVVSDFLFTPDEIADENLKNEGIPRGKIFRVGDIMVDALMWEREQAKASDILSRLGLADTPFGVVTLHRAGNVDNPRILERLVEILSEVSELCPLAFPLHPRTKVRLESFRLARKLKKTGRVMILTALGYRDFLKLMMKSQFVLTDSGGVQKETTVLGVDCLTLRETTEWPLTVSQGTNHLLGNHPSIGMVMEKVKEILNRRRRKSVVLPELWDGKTSERILNVLANKLK